MATIGSLLFKIGADTAEILDGVNKVNAKLGTMPGELEKVQSKTAVWGSFIGNVMADVAAKVGKLAVDAIGDLISRTEKMSATATAFDRLTGSVGELGSKFLEIARTATKGLISDLDLMQAANKGILLGLPITSSSFSKLAETAIVLGRAMGQGPNKSLDDLMIALGRSSPLILDNLGLSVKVGEANEKYAAQLGKSASALTEAEKKTAFYNATMAAAEQKVASLGGIQGQSIDIITKVKVAWDNLLDRMSKAIADSPVLTAALTGLSDVMTGWIAKLDQSATMSGRVDTAVLTMLKSFNGLLSGLNYVQGGFNAFQSGLAAIMESASRAVAQHLTPLKFVFEQLAKIPGPMGDSYRLGFAVISEATRFAQGSAESFAQIQREQEADFVRNSAAIEGLQGKLGGLIGKLEASKVVTKENAGAVRDNAAATDMMGKSVADAGIKVGFSLDAIKRVTKDMDVPLSSMFSKSAEGLRAVSQVAAQSTAPSFTIVGRAADEAASKVQQTTHAIAMMNTTMGANPWATSFTRGNLLTPGAGFTMSLPQYNPVTQPTWGMPTGWQTNPIGNGWWAHTGGGIDWNGIKRMHSGGLMGDERPIIGQTGEGILSRRGMDALSRLNSGGSFGGSNIYVTVNAQGAFFDTPDARERLGRMVSDAVIARMKAQGARV